jgi:hypothetical protein
MPKLTPIQKLARIREVVEQLERGEEVEAKKNAALLDDKYLKALDDAWEEQQALRKQHRPPKTEEEAKRIGWKDKREVRIEIYKQALAEGNKNSLKSLRDEQQAKEVKAARVFMGAWSKALGEGKSSLQAHSAGNIALTQAHLRAPAPMIDPRDKEIRKQERQILESMEDTLSDSAREHLEWLRKADKPATKRVRAKKA